jgi:hypothetical protein
VDGYGFSWIIATGYRQTLLKLLVIYTSGLYGVQVVAGSNPVGPTKKERRNRGVGQADSAVFFEEPS